MVNHVIYALHRVLVQNVFQYMLVIRPGEGIVVANFGIESLGERA